MQQHQGPWATMFRGLAQEIIQQAGQQLPGILADQVLPQVEERFKAAVAPVLDRLDPVVKLAERLLQYLEEETGSLDTSPPPGTASADSSSPSTPPTATDPATMPAMSLRGTATPAPTPSSSPAPTPGDPSSSSISTRPDSSSGPDATGTQPWFAAMSGSNPSAPSPQ